MQQGYPPQQGGYPPQQGGYPPQQGGYPQPGYGGGRQPIQWMGPAQGLPNCPPGLEYLASVDCFKIHQQIELIEGFTGFETANKYDIKNAIGQRVYLAVEKTDCCTRQCCGNERPFEISLYDAHQREVLKIHRKLRCDSCWCPCCLQKVEIMTPDEQLLGTVNQTWSICKPCYDIRDGAGNTTLTIVGPCLTCSFCGDVVFSIMDRGGNVQVGMLTKEWSGVVKEVFLDADNFTCSFPIDLDVTSKACILGAALLVDFMFFEKAQGESNDGIGMLG